MSAGLIDPVIYTALEIRAEVNRGERPAPEQVVGIFWARVTFKYIYSAWTTFPLIVTPGPRRARPRTSGWATLPGPEQVVDGGGEGQLALQCGPRLLPTPHPAAGLLPPLGCRWPGGAAKRRTQRPRSWGGQTPRSAPQTRAPGGTRPRPQGGRGQKVRQQALPQGGEACVRSMCFGAPWSVAWSCQASVPGKW